MKKLKDSATLTSKLTMVQSRCQTQIQALTPFIEHDGYIILSVLISQLMIAS